MRKLTLMMLFIAQVAMAQTENIQIAAGKSAELSYQEFAEYDVQLKNKTGKGIKVAVLNPETNEQIKGFGLGPTGKVVVEVPAGTILKLTNNNLVEAKVDLKFVDKESDGKSKRGKPSVSFTLYNSSLKSVPLIIPSVMNPNLSPLSSSGVGLKMGQKIYYKKGGKRKLLLIVDENIKQGDKIDVPRLIKKLEKDS